MKSIEPFFILNRLENNPRQDWSQSYEVCRSWSRMKIVYAIYCYPYKIKKLTFLSFKNADKKSTLSKKSHEDSRTEIQFLP